MEAEIKVTYTTFAEARELGDLSLSEFNSIVEFAQYLTKTIEIVEYQLKHDPQYRDVLNAQVEVILNHECVSLTQFERERDSEGTYYSTNSVRRWEMRKPLADI